MTTSRRYREKEQMKELILEAASSIIAEDGLDRLSIRKIAARIEYSPSIIYHYFKDKEEIINTVMQSGYQKIVQSVSSAKLKSLSGEERLKEMTRSYINAALSMPDEFMSVQLNSSKDTLTYTSSLFKGASREKPALASLYNCLKEINIDSDIDEQVLEMTAQMIAVSTLGLILKLITEKNIDNSQRQKLIDFFADNTVIKIAYVNNSM